MRNHGSTLSTSFTGRRLLAFLAILGLGLAPIVAENSVATATGPEPCFPSVTSGVAPAGTAQPDLVNGVYQIASKQNLVWLSWATSEFNTATSPAVTRAVALAAPYRQTAESIDLESCAWWPIGLGGEFTGKYDGAGHEIRNLLISFDPVFDENENLDFQGTIGLFSDLWSPATVEKLSLVGSTQASRGGSTFGLLTGRMRTGATVSDVHASGAIQLVLGSSPTGGLVGSAGGGRIEFSSADVQITTARNSQVGGLVGTLSSGATISASFASGSIDSGLRVEDGRSRRGGLVGEASGFIEYSYAVGTVAGRTQVGGLVGRHVGQGIIDSYSLADVELAPKTADDPNNPGNSLIDEDLSNTENFLAGSLIGAISNTQREVRRTFARGPLILPVLPAGTGLPEQMGGFASSRVDEVFDDQNVGSPVVLSDYVNLAANFWDLDQTNLPRSVGFTSALGQSGIVEGLSTSRMTSFATYEIAGWDIVEGWKPFDPNEGQVWGICAEVNGGYPFLLWQFTAETNPCGSGTGVTTSGSGSNSPGSTQSSQGGPGIHLDLQASVGGVASSTPVVIGGQGLAPGSSYSLVLREPVTTLRSGVVGNDGGFSLRSALPPTVAPGTYTLTLTATAADGSTLVLTQTFTVGPDGRFSAIGSVTGSQTGGLAATGVPGSTAVGALSVATLLVLMGVAMMAARRRAEVVSS